MSRIGPPLIDVTGVAEKTAENLSRSGIDSVETLARASIEDIASVPGFGPTRARAVRAAALALLGEQAPVKAGKKGKGRKKGKDGGKDKRAKKGGDKKKDKRTKKDKRRGKDKKKDKRKEKTKKKGAGKDRGKRKDKGKRK